MYTVLVIALLFFSLPILSYGQTPTVILPSTTEAKPTVTPTKTAEKDLVDQISDLKDRIASRVAELNLVDDRSILGTVKDVSGTRITIEDIQKKSRLIDVDEFTKFSSPSAKDSFGISDILTGTPVSAIGKYNKDSKRLLARFVDVVTIPVFLHGHVFEIDEDNFTLRVMQEDQKVTIVDVETATRTSSYADDETVRSGFTKIAPADRIHVFGYKDKKDPTRVVAARIIVFSDLPKNPRIPIPDASVGDETTVSSGSGKKLTPIR